MTSCKSWCTATTPADAPGLCVLHADAGMLVLDKPQGLLSVPGRGPDKQDCLSRRVQARFVDALVVHRLDMATSGLLLMARGAPAQALLSKAFAARTVRKRYQALVHGLLPAQGGHWQEIDLPIAVDWPNRPRRIICAAAGKPSLTRWRVLAHTMDGMTRLELEPVTGQSPPVARASAGHRASHRRRHVVPGASADADGHAPDVACHTDERTWSIRSTGASVEF